MTTFLAGQKLPAARLNNDFVSYTPTISQGGATADIAKTVTYAKYSQSGRRVLVVVAVTVTGSGTAGQPIQVSLPVTAAASGFTIGTGFIHDAGAAVYYVAVRANTTTSVVFHRDGATANVGVAPNFALAANDVIEFHVEYEAA